MKKLTKRQLGTILAALRFWQRHGPKQENSFFDRCETDEMDFLDEIRTGGGDFEDLSVEEIDELCENLNTSDYLVE
jgi:hypothetical protein